CADFHTTTYKQLMQKYNGKIRLVYRDFPATRTHPNAEKAAEAANCALQQGTDKFWALYDAMFENQRRTGVGIPSILKMAKSIPGLDTAKLDECIKSGKMAEKISKDVQAGISYSVPGTPTFFINGFRIAGAKPLDTFSKVIDQLLPSR